MRRIKLLLAYDGSSFSGWQCQKKGRTIQSEVEQAFEELIHEPVKVVGAGRTDRGVHARGQVAHADVGHGIAAERIRSGLNHFLDPAVRILSVEEKEGFHARFDAKVKTYHYLIDQSRDFMPWHRAYRHHVAEPLSLEAMEQGARYFLGQHDYSSFRGPRSLESNPVRTVDAVNIRKERELLVVEVKGQSFLRNMVRIMVGSLLEVGRGNLPPEAIREMIEARDRRAAGPTLPPEGLYLMNIHYEGGAS